MTKMESILTPVQGSNPVKVYCDQNFYSEIYIISYVFEGPDDETDVHLVPIPIKSPAREDFDQNFQVASCNHAVRPASS